MSGRGHGPGIGGGRAGQGRARQAGLVLTLMGAALVLRRLGFGGAFFEAVWLVALLFGAAWAWREVERRSGGTTWRRILLVAGVGLLAVTTLDRLAGSAFLAAVALVFWLLGGSSAGNPRRVTAHVLLAGLFATLAGVTGANALWPRWDSGALFFLGMTATFTYLYLTPRPRGGARWALWPAVVWAVLTLVVNDPLGGLARWVVPLGLIGAGVVLFGYSRGRR